MERGVAAIAGERIFGKRSDDVISPNDQNFFPHIQRKAKAAGRQPASKASRNI